MQTSLHATVACVHVAALPSGPCPHERQGSQALVALLRPGRWPYLVSPESSPAEETPYAF